MRTSSILLLGLCATASAWSPQIKPSSRTSVASSSSKKLLMNYEEKSSFDPTNLSNVQSNPNNNAISKSSPSQATKNNAILASALLPSVALLTSTPEAAHAATAFTNNAVPSALAAYGHYISLIGILGCIMAERLTIKPNMTPEEEDFIAGADIGLGLFGVGIAYTGYLRAVEYEKGFDFYAHEPLFWLKIAFVGVFGAASFFNTVTIVQRAVAKRNGKFVPMGDKLSKRMVQICNAELVAIATIPLTATFMARGVGYSQDIPWQAEAGLAAAVFAGLSFKYVKEALTFEDNPISLDSSAE